LDVESFSWTFREDQFVSEKCAIWIHFVLEESRRRRFSLKAQGEDEWRASR